MRGIKLAKIINLFTDKQMDIVEQLEYILEKAKEGEFKDFVFAANCGGEVKTAWKCIDLPKRQELLSHLQIDIINSLVLESRE